MPHVCPGSRDLSSSLSFLLANAPTPQSGSAIWPQATAAPRRILLMRGRRLFGVLFPFSPKPQCISGLSCWLQAKLICMCDPKGLLQGPGGRPARPGPARARPGPRAFTSGGRCSPGCRRRSWWSPRPTCSPCTCRSRRSSRGPQSPASRCRVSGRCGVDARVWGLH